MEDTNEENLERDKNPKVYKFICPNSTHIHRYSKVHLSIIHIHAPNTGPIIAHPLFDLLLLQFDRLVVDENTLALIRLRRPPHAHSPSE